MLHASFTGFSNSSIKIDVIQADRRDLFYGKDPDR